MEGGTGERAEAAERMAALEWRHGARADLMLDAEFWKALCPLHVEDPQMASLAHASVLQLDPDVIDTCRERMGIEGFFTIPATSLSWAVDVPELAAAIQSLGVAGLSPAFLLVFDEPWVMAHQVRLVMCMQRTSMKGRACHLVQLKDMLLTTTGNRLVMDWCIFSVGAAAPTAAATAAAPLAACGWPPHRDRGTDESKACFNSDGMPQ